jgi:hypothetical protein
VRECDEVTRLIGAAPARPEDAADGLEKSHAVCIAAPPALETTEGSGPCGRRGGRRNGREKKRAASRRPSGSHAA